MYKRKSGLRKSSKLQSVDQPFIKSRPCRRSKINLNQKRIRQVKYPLLDNELFAFYTRHDGTSILSDDVLREKPRQIRDTMGITEEQIGLSNGWLEKFKTRGIMSHVLHGESDSFNKSSLHTDRLELQELLSHYSPDDIFNVDETALFYRLPPNRTLATIKRNGRKLCKDRLTIGFCCNLSGSENIDPLVIGKSAKPRCFKGANMDKKKIMYYSNKKAWRTR